MNAKPLETQALHNKDKGMINRSFAAFVMGTNDLASRHASTPFCNPGHCAWTENAESKCMRTCLAARQKSRAAKKPQDNQHQ